MFIKRLGIKLRTISEANKNYNYKNERNSSLKEQYKKDCNFKFDPYSYPNIPGYNLLLEKGIYHPSKNLNGVCRDHILSKEYGWRSNIEPNIVSHPANCQFISNKDNIKKSSSSMLSEMELKDRINNWNNEKIKPIEQKYKKLQLTEDHRKKISKTLTGRKYINYELLEKVNSIKEKCNYSPSRISKELSIDRSTARKYMNLKRGD